MKEEEWFLQITTLNSRLLEICQFKKKRFLILREKFQMNHRVRTLFMILHRNRVDSADAEKDFEARESTVRITDCVAFSILKTVPVSQDSKELCLMEARRICPQQYKTFI